jgi:hypothetical protein
MVRILQEVPGVIMAIPNHQFIIIYREENTTIWHQTMDVGNLEFEMSSLKGLTANFQCAAFRSLGSGEFIGELIILEIHPHSIDARYAPKVAFEYRIIDELFQVRLQIHAAPLPIVPVDWKQYVLAQNHMLSYTAKANTLSPFLALISNNQLEYTNHQVLGTQILVRLQLNAINPNLKLGRSSPIISLPIATQAIAIPSQRPTKTFFQRLMRRT